MTIVLPPVEPDLPRLVDGADDQPDADCEELDFGDRDANVAGDGKSLVDHAVENIDDATGAMTCGSLYEHSLPLRRTEAVQQRWCLVWPTGSGCGETFLPISTQDLRRSPPGLNCRGLI